MVDLQIFLMQPEAHLAAIIESSDDAIISKDLNGTILTWNGGAERVYGYSAADAVGKPMTILLPESRANEEESILRQLRSGERVSHFETTRVRQSFWCTVGIRLSLNRPADTEAMWMVEKIEISGGFVRVGRR